MLHCNGASTVMLPPDCRLDMMLGGIAAVIVGGVLLICCYIAFLGGSDLELGMLEDAGTSMLQDCQLLSCGAPVRTVHGAQCQVLATVLPHDGASANLAKFALSSALCNDQATVDRIAQLALPATVTCFFGNASTPLGLVARLPPTLPDKLVFLFSAAVPFICVLLGGCLAVASHPDTSGIVRTIEQRTRIGLLPRCDIEIDRHDCEVPYKLI